MTDEYVLDSSIIAAIFFHEKSSPKAVEVVARSKLITVDLARVEVSNVAWKRIQLFNENPEITFEALKKSMKFIKNACTVIKTEEIIDESFHIGLRENVTFYDALFLAASEKCGVPLLTLDKRLVKTGLEVYLL